MHPARIVATVLACVAARGVTLHFPPELGRHLAAPRRTLDGMKTDHRREGETDAEAFARVFIAAGIELDPEYWSAVDLDQIRAQVERDREA